MDRLRQLAAQKSLRDSELQQKNSELNRLAPNDLDQLRENLVKLQNRLDALNAMSITVTDLPESEADLEIEINELNASIQKAQQVEDELGRRRDEVVKEIEGETDAAASKQGQRKGLEQEQRTEGLRQRAATAKSVEAGHSARVELLRQNLEQLPTAEQIANEVRTAKDAHENALDALGGAKLTDSEQTVEERLKSAKEATGQITTNLDGVRKELNTISGQLREAEGLHQRRTAIGSRVVHLREETNRGRLESAAHNRLLELFEECREKQLSIVMGPIHDRLVRWMRLLRIGDYNTVRFNDSFLPESLIAQGGAFELALAEESTGTIEQLGLMVRLALGAALSSFEESAVAILDDPLTHSSLPRLTQMRGVLRAAAAGDTASTQPAGPLQIIVLTCHPEWFSIDGARVIDLGDATILERRQS
jgi:hypothetical protein